MDTLAGLAPQGAASAGLLSGRALAGRALLNLLQLQVVAQKKASLEASTVSSRQQPAWRWWLVVPLFVVVAVVAAFSWLVVALVILADYNLPCASGGRLVVELVILAD